MHQLKYVLLIMMLFLGQLVLAQSIDNVLDSLQNLLDDTQLPQKRVRILLQMSEQARVKTSLSKAERYVAQALSTAKEQQNQKLITDVSVEQGVVLSEKGNHDAAENIFLKALNTYEQLGDEKQIIKCLT